MSLGDDSRLRLDNTLKYSAAARVEGRSAALVGDPNLDDGDRNFGRGLISNRVDWLGELDLSRGNVGLRLSAAAWYDDVYHRRTDHDSPSTASAASVPPDRFTRATRDLHGSKGELLDAFAYANVDIGGMQGNVKVGRHSLLWGESLFFGGNGIAGGQLPIDAIKALSVPNTPFKEIGRPVNQVSAQLQITPTVSVGAYYQLRWERTRVPASGSYFSPADIADAGGERILVNLAPPMAFYRAADIAADDSGQGGLQLRWRVNSIGTDFGVYVTRYHDRNFQTYVRPGAGIGPGSAADMIGQYVLVFPEGVRSIGASASTTIGDANVAAEVSLRTNAPLVSMTMPDMTGTGDNDRNPLYAVGRTAHAQVSMIYLLPQSSLWQGATLLGEVAWNRVLSVRKNPGALDPNTTRDALGVRFVFEPQYFQVLDGVDISVPVGVGYTIDGRSGAVGGFGPEHGGDFSIGVKGDFDRLWRFAAGYTHYFGSGGPVAVDGVQTFKQTYADRDFVSLSISRTF
ncbi:MAG: DUF1302 domain-containing protein [Gammaproteobacteria bacterium]|nr:DUF1302 domain-containing protein [Gammaproteobacteria bacterium]